MCFLSTNCLPAHNIRSHQLHNFMYRYNEFGVSALPYTWKFVVLKPPFNPYNNENFFAVLCRIRSPDRPARSYTDYATRLVSYDKVLLNTQNGIGLYLARCTCVMMTVTVWPTAECCTHLCGTDSYCTDWGGETFSTIDWIIVCTIIIQLCCNVLCVMLL